MRLLATASLTLLLIAGCGAAVEEQHSATPPDSVPDVVDLAPMPPFGSGEITLVGPDGTQIPMAVYVADEPATLQQGLMGVTDLPREAGMVFLTGQDRDHGFWMKNTLLPLSIAYLDADGAVVAVLDMEPCEADPCPSYPPGATYRHALEVHQGRFTELGVDEQWRVELPAGETGS